MIFVLKAGSKIIVLLSISFFNSDSYTLYNIITVEFINVCFCCLVLGRGWRERELHFETHAHELIYSDKIIFSDKNPDIFLRRNCGSRKVNYRKM